MCRLRWRAIESAGTLEAVAKGNPNNTIDQLNVAMMHRILSFSELIEGGGREDLEKAIGITDRLVKLEPQNPKVKSERSIEYQNLGFCIRVSATALTRWNRFKRCWN